MNVCVYCSSSDRVERVYFDVAAGLGRLIGQRRNNLVFGGGNTGPMRELALAVKENGGRVLSVLPKTFEARGLRFDRADEVVVADTLQDRSATMLRESDVFVALPGGIGTLGEVAENLALRQLDLHHRPLCLVNVNGFWDPFTAFLDLLVDGQFVKPEHRALLHTAASPEEALTYLDRYAPVDVPDKWS
jgi:cytokinin riboside 5'-monophosphate phosphoribohydrolase